MKGTHSKSIPGHKQIKGDFPKGNHEMSTLQKHPWSHMNAEAHISSRRYANQQIIGKIGKTCVLQIFPIISDCLPTFSNYLLIWDSSRQVGQPDLPGRVPNHQIIRKIVKTQQIIGKSW